MTLALEINDVGLVLARDGELLAEEPGCALERSPPGCGTSEASSFIAGGDIVL